MTLDDPFNDAGPSSGITLHLNNNRAYENAVSKFSKWKVIFHGELNEVIYGCLQDSYNVNKSLHISGIYSHKQFIKQNVPGRPCFTVDKVNKCRLRCYDSLLIKNSTCRYPFVSTVKVDLPECSKDELRSLSMLEDYNFSSCTEMCGIPCIKSFNEMQVDTWEVSAATGITVISIQPARAEIEILRETRSYVLYNLLCELGGMLGLYLGACLLTFVEIIDWLGCYVCVKVDKSHVRPVLKREVRPKNYHF